MRFRNPGVSGLLLILKREVPACAFGVWNCAVWLSFGYIFTSRIQGAAAHQMWLGWIGLSFFGGIAATLCCQAASYGRTPEGVRAAIAVTLTAALTVLPVTIGLFGFMPRQAWSAAALMFGGRLTGDAFSMATWCAMRERVPAVAAFSMSAERGEPIGLQRAAVLAAYGLLVCLPTAVGGAAIIFRLLHPDF